MKKIVTILIALTFGFFASAQPTETLDVESEKAAVINLVEQFLTAAGNYDLDLIPAMYCEKSNISGAYKRELRLANYCM